MASAIHKHTLPLTAVTRPNPNSDGHKAMAMAVGARDGMEQGQEQVRLKLSYRGRTFRRSVDVRAFTWEAFLRWCVCHMCVKLCVCSMAG